MVGVGAVPNADTTPVDAADTVAAEVNPDFTPVTATLTNLPRSDACNSYVLPIAPPIGVYGPLAVAADDH
jgi:hypothetical protein